MHQCEKDTGNKTNHTELQVFFSAHQKVKANTPLKQNKKKLKEQHFGSINTRKRKLEGLSPKFPSKNLHYYTSEPVKVIIDIHKKVRRNKRELQTNEKTINEGDELMYKWFLPNASEEKGNEQYKTTHQIKHSGEQTNQL